MTRPTGARVESAHEARRLLRRARARASRRPDRFVDAYVVGFTVLLVSVWMLSFVREVAGGARCLGDCPSANAAVLPAAGWALMLGGLLVLGLAAIGPVSSGRPEARWLLGTTADRAVLLRGALLAAAGTSALAGILAGLVTATAAGGGELAVLPMLVGAGTGAVLGLAVALALLVAQSRWATVGASGVGAAALVTGLVLLAVARFGEPGEVGNGAGRLVLALVVAGAVSIVVATGTRASRLLRRLDDAGLANGRETLDAVVGSVAAMDGQVAEGLRRRRRAARRGRFASRRGRGRGALALLHADLTATRRRAHEMALHLLWVPVVVGVAAGLGDDAALVAAALAATSAARSGGVGLRTWLGSPGLRRAVTAPHPAVVAALAVVPALVAGVVSLPVVVLVGAPVWAAVYLTAVALAAAIRSADPVGRELGALVATPMGALPLGLVRAVAHGPDVAVASGILLAVWTQPPLLPLGIAVLSWQLMRPRA